MSFLKSLQKIVSIPSVALGNLATKGIEKITGNTYGRQTIESFVSSKPGDILSKGMVVSVGALAVATGTASAIVKQVISKPLQTASVVVATPVIAGILKEKPKEVTDFFIGEEQVKSRIELGKDIALGKDIDIGKAVTTAGVVGAVAGIIAVAPKVKDKVKDIIPNNIPSLPELPSISPGVVADMPVETAQPLNPSLLPQTVDITPKKRKKRATKPQTQLNIINRNYIKVNNFC